jgi:hypothetical protein
LNCGQIGSRVDERAERHVAADSARTIEIGSSHIAASNHETEDSVESLFAANSTASATLSPLAAMLTHSAIAVKVSPPCQAQN